MAVQGVVLDEREGHTVPASFSELRGDEHILLLFVCFFILSTNHKQSKLKNVRFCNSESLIPMIYYILPPQRGQNKLITSSGVTYYYSSSNPDVVRKKWKRWPKLLSG